MSRYFDAEPLITSQQAYLYAMGISLCTVGLVMLHHPYFFSITRLGMQLRIASSALIYRKVCVVVGSKTFCGSVCHRHVLNYISEGDFVLTPVCVIFCVPSSF